MVREAFMKLAIAMIKLDLNVNDSNQVQIAFDTLSLRHKLCLKHYLSDVGYKHFKSRLINTINN